MAVSDVYSFHLFVFADVCAVSIIANRTVSICDWK